MYTKHKWFCLENKQIHVAVIGRTSHGDIQDFNTAVQKVQTHMEKYKTSYPGDV